MRNYSVYKKSVTYLLLFMVLLQCKQPQKPINISPVYIYDSERVLKMIRHEDNSTMNYSDSTKLLYSFYTLVKDSAGGVNFYFKVYNLSHYTKFYLNSKEFRDTSFTKYKSYLDSINYFDSKWLTNQEKLDSFWQPTNCWRCGGSYDTLRTYMILPVENTDSVIFLQVHRWFHTSL